MNEEELKKLIESIVNKKTSKGNKINEITIADMSVTSNVENLDKLKKVVNELIEKNYKFVTDRKRKRFNELFGYVG